MVEKRKPVPAPTRERLEILRSVCVISTITREDIPVLYRDDIHTAQTDLSTIYITHNSVPENLRGYDDVVFVALKGQTLHEAGHVKYTVDVDQDYKKWAERLHKSELTALIRNLVEDARINFRMSEPYRHGVGENLKDWHRVLGASWAHTQRKEIAEEATKAGKDWSGIPTKKELINSFIALKGLYGRDAEVDEIMKDYYPNIEKEWLDDMNKGADILKKARTHRIWLKELFPDANNLYRIMQKYAPDGIEGGGGEGGGGRGGDGEGQMIDGMPGEDKPEGRIVRGGGMDPKNWPAPYGKKELEAPGELVTEAEDAQKEKDKKSQSLKAGKGRGAGAGKGTGEDIEYPRPDEAAYKRRRDKLASIIQQMRNMLKFESRPKYETVKYRPQGRMMQGLLAGAVVNARNRPITDIYSKNTVKYEKQETTLALVVDLSGSTDFETMVNTLTIIAEVAGMWLPDENWGIFAFGTNFQKIKTFFEQYETTKFRIGGMEGLGGTELGVPLFKIREMFRVMKKKPGNKVCIIVSDFDLFGDDPHRCKVQIDRMRKEANVQTICIVNAYDRAMPSAMEKAKVLSKHVVPMPNVGKLAVEFFKVYKRLSYSDLDPMFKKGW